MPTVSLICAWIAAVLGFPWPVPEEEEDPSRGRYGSTCEQLAWSRIAGTWLTVVKVK
ncbi:hypothetical protein Ac2012v2_007241 [Leucoagaricus gongylophorus]